MTNPWQKRKQSLNSDKAIDKEKRVLKYNNHEYTVTIKYHRKMQKIL